MNYSPIIAPLVFLIIWKQVAWLTGFPALYRAIMARARDQLTRDQMETRLKEQLPWNAQEHPIEFDLVCTALAFMGSGGGVDAWLAWAFVGCWTMQSLSEVSWKNKLGWRIRMIGNLCVYALALHAGVQITRDMLAAYG